MVAGVVTAYFVGTALTSVRPASSWTRVINATALAVAVVLIFWSLVSGATFINTPGRDANGVPFRTAGVMSLVVATVLAMAAAGDVRIMRAGMPRGAPRLARHLWRMCFALFIAAESFFSVRERVAKVLPAPFTSGWMRALPILLLFAAMFYWLWRVRRHKALPGLVRYDLAPVTSVLHPPESDPGRSRFRQLRRGPLSPILRGRGSTRAAAEPVTRT